MTIGLLPATSDGELAAEENTQRLTCPLYPALNEVPELAAAFSAILAAIPATRQWMESNAGQGGQAPANF